MDTIKGYPVGDSSGLFKVEIHGEEQEIQEGGDFIENYPPKPGDPLFKVRNGTRQAVGFVLKQRVEPRISESFQYWEVEQVI